MGQYQRVPCKNVAMSWWESFVWPKKNRWVSLWEKAASQHTRRAPPTPCSLEYQGLSLGPAGTQHPGLERGISSHTQRCRNQHPRREGTGLREASFLAGVPTVCGGYQSALVCPESSRDRQQASKDTVCERHGKEGCRGGATVRGWGPGATVLLHGCFYG